MIDISKFLDIYCSRAVSSPWVELETYPRTYVSEFTPVVPVGSTYIPLTLYGHFLSVAHLNVIFRDTISSGIKSGTPIFINATPLRSKRSSIQYRLPTESIVQYHPQFSTNIGDSGVTIRSSFLWLFTSWFDNGSINNRLQKETQHFVDWWTSVRDVLYDHNTNLVGFVIVIP